jgi:hypothetical protein
MTPKEAANIANELPGMPPMHHGSTMTDEAKQKVLATFDEWQRTIKTYSTMSALHTLAQYWVETEVIFEQAAAKEAALFEPHSPAASLLRAKHDHTLIPTHRYSCIVMLVSNIERELSRLVENLETERGKQKLKLKDLYGRSNIEKISTFCDVVYDLRLADCANFESIHDLRRIRDCIVHALGEVSLLKSEEDKKHLVNLKDKRRGFSANVNHDIRISDECFKQFLVEVWGFFVSVFGALDWEIASHWHGNKLETTFAKLKK